MQKFFLSIRSAYKHVHRYRTISIWAFLLLLLPKSTVAQSETNFLLPPLDTLIGLALKNSPVLKAHDVWIETQRQEWRLQQKSWVDLISVGATALAGNDNMLYDQQSALGTDRISVDRRNAVFNAGLSVRFTLGDVLNRDEKSHIKFLEYEKSALDRKVREKEIQEEMLIRYDRFLASRNLIELETENVESMRMALEVVEQYFKAGNFPVNEYSTLRSRFVAAKKLLEEVKMETKHRYRLVLEMAGLNQP